MTFGEREYLQSGARLGPPGSKKTIGQLEVIQDRPHVKRGGGGTGNRPKGGVSG